MLPLFGVSFNHWVTRKQRMWETWGRLRTHMSLVRVWWDWIIPSIVSTNFHITRGLIGQSNWKQLSRCSGPVKLRGVWVCYSSEQLCGTLVLYRCDLRWFNVTGLWRFPTKGCMYVFNHLYDGVLVWYATYSYMDSELKRIVSKSCRQIKSTGQVVFLFHAEGFLKIDQRLFLKSWIMTGCGTDRMQRLMSHV